MCSQGKISVDNLKPSQAEVFGLDQDDFERTPDLCALEITGSGK